MTNERLTCKDFLSECMLNVLSFSAMCIIKILFSLTSGTLRPASVYRLLKYFYLVPLRLRTIDLTVFSLYLL